MIAPEIKKIKTRQTPFVHAYRLMPFKLYNTPTKFQQCMMTIFTDTNEDIIKIFMDAFLMFDSSFDKYL